MTHDQLLQNLGDAEVAAIWFAAPDLLLTFALAGSGGVRTLRFAFACELQIAVDHRTPAELKQAPQMLVWEVTSARVDNHGWRILVDCAQQGSISLVCNEVSLEPEHR